MSKLGCFLLGMAATVVLEVLIGSALFLWSLKQSGKKLW